VMHQIGTLPLADRQVMHLSWLRIISKGGYR
jgi:hypothetical protein